VVEALTALIAQLLGWLHGLTVDAVCPGGWPWAVSLLGVAVGLLPAAGAAAVARWRRRAGSRYGPGRRLGLGVAGVLAAGLAPLLVFVATGRVFATAAAGSRVDGLTTGEVRSLGRAVCAVGPQAGYLGEGSVAQAFTPGGSLQVGVALLTLVAMPLVAVLFTACSARLALRRGPRWPARLFWLPLLAVAVLTAPVPAGTAGHLWLGAAAGAFLGMPVVLAVGPPDWAVVHRSLAQPPAREAASRDTATGRPTAGRSAGTAAGGTAEAGGAGAAARSGWGSRLAARFASRSPEPLVTTSPSGGGPAPAGGAAPAAAHVPPPARAGRVLPRTLVAAPGPPASVPAPARGRPRPARFRLVRPLGDGGFGRVWLAHDARLGHTVALKAALVRDADTEERIRREAQALAAVRHPHCVQIHDLVPAESDPGLAQLDGMVIVMEYVRGQSLGQLVRAQGAVDDVAAARVWSSIAGALDAAHAQGVLHRDVKPGNIVLDADGQAHLIDFGIARRSGDVTLTAAGFVLGTPDFLPPEVAAGARATRQSDSWQLAATIGYALTGHPPRGDHTDALSGLRAAAVGGPPTHLPARSAHLRLLQAALGDDAGRRPSLPAVQAALEAWRRSAGARPGGPVTAAPSPR
jgi:predicted Ser/Thr protein kinase